jgi:undecaprenyl-phosphate 4-deoxy-4-formamido-L-arabinose transferase
VQVSIVIPTYGNASGIGTTVARLKQFLDHEAGTTFEVVFVDDMSPDGTWPALVAAIGDDRRFSAHRLAKNVGQHRATRIGLGLATGRLLLTMDDDLQHPVEEIPVILKAARDEVDVVYGIYRERQHDAWRRFASWAASVTLRMTLGLTRTSAWQRPTSFRVLSRRIVERVRRADTHSFMLDGFLHAHTSRIEYVLVRHDARSFGRSSYTLRKLIRLYLNLVFGYSVKPLDLVWTLGVAFSIPGLLLALFMAGHLVSRGTADVGGAIVACGLLLAGVQLLATAVIGQYVGRTFLQRSLLDDDMNMLVEHFAPPGAVTAAAPGALPADLAGRP